MFLAFSAFLAPICVRVRSGLLLVLGSLCIPVYTFPWLFRLAESRNVGSWLCLAASDD